MALTRKSRCPRRQGSSVKIRPRGGFQRLVESRRNLLSARVATRSEGQSWGHVTADRQGTVAGWMTVSTKLDQGQESGNHSRVLIDRCDQSLLISVFDKLTWASVVVSSRRMRTCHHAGRACVGVRLSGAPARRLMSPDEPTSDDPNCKRRQSVAGQPDRV